MAKVEVFWYVEPLDAHTNEVISREAVSYGLSEERDLRPRDAKHGISLWRCRHLFIERLRGSKRDLGLRFRVYSQRGSAGPLRKTALPRRKNVSSRKALSDARAITQRVRRRAS